MSYTHAFVYICVVFVHARQKSLLKCQNVGCVKFPFMDTKTRTIKASVICLVHTLLYWLQTSRLILCASIVLVFVSMKESYTQRSVHTFCTRLYAKFGKKIVHRWTFVAKSSILNCSKLDCAYCPSGTSPILKEF